MKASKVKELIKQSLLELEAEKKNTSNSGPMTPEEEEMIKRYEEEEANKYALEKEEPLEEGDVMKKAREIVAKHKEMTEGEEGPEDISDYDRGKIETGKANTLARSINAAIAEVDPELHVETFAKGVAQVLKREYGSHLTREFIAALRDNLRGYEDIVSEADSIVESWKRKNLLKESKKKGRKILKESADSAVSKHSAGLLKALGARAKYPEDEIAYREVEKHLKAIATELGLDASLPFMEDEMYSGKAKPEEALKYTKEMFNSWLEDSGMAESKRHKALKESADLLDQYLSIIQSNDMDSDQAHNYLENQGLDPQQIDSIMNHAFPTSSDSYEESDYIKRRKKEMYEVSDPDKVTYLGHPAEITKVNKEMTGAITYNVSYDKGNGKTKATNLSNKGGEIKMAEAMDINDPILMKARAAAFQRSQPKPEPSKPSKAFKNADKIKTLERERVQLMRDMEQEAEPEGGPIADKYGALLDKIDKVIAKLKGQDSMMEEAMTTAYEAKTETGIQAHYEEWTAVKDQYGTIEDYFADVEKNGDWY